MNVVPFRIQIITIFITLLFLIYIGRLIVKGKLREEYSFFWIVLAIILGVFSIWRDGLDIIAKSLGVYMAPNLVFTAAIFAIFVYLIHLSIVVSKLHNKNKDLTQEIAIMKTLLEDLHKKELTDNSENNQQLTKEHGTER